jgi:hypothetical protein
MSQIHKIHLAYLANCRPSNMGDLWRVNCRAGA